MGLWGVDSSLDSDVTKKNTDISMSLRPRSLTPRLGTLNELLWAELHRTAADSNGLSQNSGKYLAVCLKIAIFPSERCGPALPGALGEVFGLTLLELSSKICPFCI